MQSPLQYPSRQQGRLARWPELFLKIFCGVTIAVAQILMGHQKKFFKNEIPKLSKPTFCVCLLTAQALLFVSKASWGVTRPMEPLVGQLEPI